MPPSNTLWHEKITPFVQKVSEADLDIVITQSPDKLRGQGVSFTKKGCISGKPVSIILDIFIDGDNVNAYYKPPFGAPRLNQVDESISDLIDQVSYGFDPPAENGLPFSQGEHS